MNDQVTPQETAEILRLAEQTISRHATGDFVELGCYRGDTSVLLAKLLQKSAPKRLWIYDSFAGLPEKTREDQSGAGANFKAGELLVTKREVVEKLRRHGFRTSSSPLPAASVRPAQAQNSSTQQSSFAVIVKKAWFDNLTPEDLPTEISFAFCDGDLYSSIKTSLRLVVPRLSDQGIIIVHDYNNPELPGSAKAVDEFLKSHPDFTLKIHYTLAILTKN